MHPFDIAGTLPASVWNPALCRQVTRHSQGKCCRTALGGGVSPHYAEECRETVTPGIRVQPRLTDRIHGEVAAPRPFYGLTHEHQFPCGP